MSLMDDLRTLARWVPATDASNAAAAYDRIRAFIEQHEPWYPPQPGGYGPWIEYKPGDTGPRIGEHVITLERNERERREADSTCSLHAYQWSWVWDNSGTDIVAYCVKLEDKET